MELPTMQNITKTRETLAQIGIACLQVAHGCERLQSEPIEHADLCELTAALREVSEYSEKMMSSGIDPEKDHDGDTQPSGEPPKAPMCKCGHPQTDHMPPSVATPIFPAGCCIFCPCERFQA